MQSLVLSLDRRTGIIPRLASCGMAPRHGESTDIRSLDEHSLSQVYVVPFDRMARGDWAEVRVQLARAARYYVVVGEDLSSEQIVEATRDGAYDVIDAGRDSDHRIRKAIESAGEAQRLWHALYGSLREGKPQKLVGRSAPLSALRTSIERLGPTKATVLINGESGTGKERVAEALHEASGAGTFVPVNCAAIPKDLIEAELFGVEKGAYTGATRDRRGLVEEAAGGTLFLDEIGELDITLQPKLLRFLETRRARRVGSSQEYACEVRVISATNVDLEAAMAEGTFRPDLYYRLSEIILSIPPLRHRKGDIADLVQLFIEGSGERLGKHFERAEPELIRRFTEYDWPGNVRELKQAVDRMAILYDGPLMRAGWWTPPQREGSPKTNTATGAAPPANRAPAAPSESAPPTEAGTEALRKPLPGKNGRIALANQLMAESNGDLGWVAAQLGIHPTTLYRWRKAGKVG